MQRAIFWSFCLISMGFSQGISNLLHIKEVPEGNSTQLVLTFGGGIPTVQNTVVQKEGVDHWKLIVDVKQAIIDSEYLQRESYPDGFAWQKNGDVLRLQFPLMDSTAVSGVWLGDEYQISLAQDVLQRKPFWKKPWPYVLTALIGGVVLWWVMRPSPSADKNIPQPDIKLPE